MAKHLGLDCKLYVGGTEFKNVRDVTLNMETGEADVTTRASNGWREYLATLKEASLEFEMMVDSTDSDYTTMRSAFLNNTALSFRVTDDNGTGISFTGMVTGFSNSQPLEEGDSVSVTVRPTSVNASGSGNG